MYLCSCFRGISFPSSGTRQAWNSHCHASRRERFLTLASLPTDFHFPFPEHLSYEQCFHRTCLNQAQLIFFPFKSRPYSWFICSVWTTSIDQWWNKCSPDDSRSVFCQVSAIRTSGL